MVWCSVVLVTTHCTTLHYPEPVHCTACSTVLCTVLCTTQHLTMSTWCCHHSCCCYLMLWYLPDLGFCDFGISRFPISRYLRFWDSPFPISPFRRSLQLRCCYAVASYYILRASSYILRYAHCTALPCSTCSCPMLRVGSNPLVTACAGAQARLCFAAVAVLYHCAIPTLCPLCLVQ